MTKSPNKGNRDGALAGINVLGLITARAGSVRLPDKNGRIFAGKSLLSITIEEALKASSLDMVGLSTDSEVYLNIAKDTGLDEEYRRPAELATSTATSEDCALHYVDSLPSDYYPPITHIMILQPTSPLRTASKIDKAIRQWARSGKKSLVSVVAPAANPAYLLSVNRITRDTKQESPDCDREFFVVDGSIFIAGVADLRAGDKFWNAGSELFIDTHPLAFDIDTELDFRGAEALFEANVGLSNISRTTHKS